MMTVDNASDVNVTEASVGTTVVETTVRTDKPAKPAKATKAPKPAKVKAEKVPAEPKPKNRAIYTFTKDLREKMTSHIKDTNSTKRAFVSDLMSIEQAITDELRELGFGFVNARDAKTERCSVPVSDELKECLDRMSKATGLQKQECLMLLINRKLQLAPTA